MSKRKCASPLSEHKLMTELASQGYNGFLTDDEDQGSLQGDAFSSE